MELNWYGLSCFRISERKHATIVTDPYKTGLGFPALKLRANVVTTSVDDNTHIDVRSVSGWSHTLTGPGEYEIGNVFITAIHTADEGENGRNTVYLFDYDGLTVAHLGMMDKVPKQTHIEALEQVNILLVPVGGGGSLSAAQASELVSMLEPNIVIPMFYQTGNVKMELEGVDRFLKEMGVTEPADENSLKISSGSLPEETETVLLSPKG